MAYRETWRDYLKDEETDGLDALQHARDAARDRYNAARRKLKSRAEARRRSGKRPTDE